MGLCIMLKLIIFCIYSTLLLIFSLLIGTPVDKIYEDVYCGQRNSCWLPGRRGGIRFPGDPLVG